MTDFVGGSEILAKLNDEQRVAAADVSASVLVTAGAGSGKTRMLTHRIAHLVVDMGVDPYSILAITFTNKAANEMRERLEAMNLPASKMWISTFHSMCARMLRKYATKIGYKTNFSIYGDDEKKRIITAILKEKKEDCDNEDVIKMVISAISDAKNDGYSPDEYFVKNKERNDIELICDVFSQYQKQLKENNSLDYDDLLNKTFEVLKTDSEAREFYQQRFEYIHIDEFQDTNVIQYKIVKILGEKHQNVFIVGDEDQSIYGWRGASISNMYDFKRDFNAKVYKLERNYRSTKNILNLANKIIKNNSSRIDKRLWTDAENGPNAEMITATGDIPEAEAVVAKIAKLVSSGYKYSDIAILMRLNALTRSFEQRLTYYGVPYKIFGGFKFYDRKEIKDVLAYMRVIANGLDNEALRRIINYPKRGIGDGTVGQLFNYAKVVDKFPIEVVMSIEESDLPSGVIKKVKPFAEIMRELIAFSESASPSAIVYEILNKTNMIGEFLEDNDENLNRKMNIDAFIDEVRHFEESNPKCSLDDYLQNVSLYSDVDDMNDKDNYVSVATVHSAKGLEFRAVFVVGLEEGIFPVSRASNSLEEEEEERRLMYVAITRAKERLFLSRATRRFIYGQTKDSLPSRFLQELGVNTAPVRALANNNQTHKGYDDYYERDEYYNDYPHYSTKISQNQQNQGTMRDINGKNEVKNTLAPSEISVGAKVEHKKFGVGIVRSINNVSKQCYAEIEFEKLGRITLAVAYAPLALISE